jgi:hypothetical protein
MSVPTIKKGVSGRVTNHALDIGLHVEPLRRVVHVIQFQEGLMEIDPIVTAVQELRWLAGVKTPVIDVVLALVQERARVAGLYPTDHAHLEQTPKAEWQDGAKI